MLFDANWQKAMEAESWEMLFIISGIRRKESETKREYINRIRTEFTQKGASDE